MEDNISQENDDISDVGSANVDGGVGTQINGLSETPQYDLRPGHGIRGNEASIDDVQKQMQSIDENAAKQTIPPELLQRQEGQGSVLSEKTLGNPNLLAEQIMAHAGGPLKFVAARGISHQSLDDMFDGKPDTIDPVAWKERLQNFLGKIPKNDDQVNNEETQNNIATNLVSNFKNDDELVSAASAMNHGAIQRDLEGDHYQESLTNQEQRELAANYVAKVDELQQKLSSNATKSGYSIVDATTIGKQLNDMATSMSQERTMAAMFNEMKKYQNMFENFKGHGELSTKAVRNLGKQGQKLLSDQDVWGPVASRMNDHQKVLSPWQSARSNLLAHFADNDGSSIGAEVLDPNLISMHLASVGMKNEDKAKTNAIHSYDKASQKMRSILSPGDESQDLIQNLSDNNIDEETRANMQKKIKKMYPGSDNHADVLDYLVHIRDRANKRFSKGFDTLLNKSLEQTREEVAMQKYANFLNGSKNEALSSEKISEMKNLMKELQENPENLMDTLGIATSLLKSAPRTRQALIGTTAKAISYLEQSIPKDKNGSSPLLQSPNYDQRDIRSFSKRLDAINDPYSILKNPSKEGSEAVRAVYPTIYDQMTNHLIGRLGYRANDEISRRSKLNIDQVFGLKLSSKSTEAFQRLQSTFAGEAQRQETQQVSSKKSSGKAMNIANQSQTQSEKISSKLS